MQSISPSRILLMLLFLFLVFQGSQKALATTLITVDTFIDDLDTNGNCSLREAVIAANSDMARDACPAGSGADTILLQAGTYTLSIAGQLEDSSLQGDLDLTANLTLQGAGMGSTVIDADNLDRAFQIFSPAQVTMNGLTIRNGDTSTGVGPAYSGGGISLISGSSLTLNDIHLDSNHAGDSGGGIYNNAGTTALDHVILSQNQAGYFGGAIRNLGTLNMSNTSVDGNQAVNAGGGIHSSYVLNMETSTLSGNIAGSNGGGLYLSLGSALLTNVTISGNTASETQGGGIWIYYQTELSVINSTITGNYAGQGGGIYNNHQQGLATGEVIAESNAPQLAGNIQMKNTILAGNTLTNCGRSAQTEPILSLGHNLESANTCEFAAPGDMVNTDPLLGPLQNNGGATHTHALLDGSLAIESGDNSGCPSTDQRGVPRPQGAACDIGSYERILSGESNLSLHKVDAVDPVIVGDNITYTLTVYNSGPDTAQNVSLSDILPGSVTLVSAIPGQGSCGEAGGIVSCSLGNLPNEGSTSVVIVVTTTEAFLLTNSASVSSDTADPNPADNSDSETTVVDPLLGVQADLSLNKVDMGDPIVVGGNITYTLTVSNNGPDTAQNVTLSDTLPGSVVFVSAAPAQGSCEEASGVVSCDLEDIPNGDNTSVVIIVTATISGNITNTASVSAYTADPYLTDNTDSETTAVTPEEPDVIYNFLPLILSTNG